MLKGLMLLVFCCIYCFADNPLITSCYTADPSVHVWPGSDAIWMYSSHDVDTTFTHASMREYRVFKSYDLVNWIDHGCVLDIKDITWASKQAWAIDAVYRNGLYYLIFCAIERATGVFKTGLATSDQPQGPFKDIGFIKEINWGQDPALIVDDDDTPYLFWGSGGGCNACQLTSDLKSVVPGTIVDLKKQLTWVFEGPWVHKYNGKFYLSYPGLFDKKWPEHMFYATSDKPLGPYKYGGKYMGAFDKMAGTNHGSIVKIRDRWYAFYHSAWLSGGNSTRRSVHADYLTYNSDGTINEIKPSKAGVKALFPESAPNSQPSKTFVVLEAENGPPAKGTLSGVVVDSSKKGFSGRGYVTGFDKSGDFVSVTVNFAKSGSHYVRIFYRCEGTKKVNILSINGQNSTDKTFPVSDTFVGLDLGKIAFKAGDNTIKITYKEGLIDIDYFMVTPELELFPPKSPQSTGNIAPKQKNMGMNYADIPISVEYTPSGAMLRLKLSSAEKMSIGVFTHSGKLVCRLVNGLLPKGETCLNWSTDDRVASGIYYFRVQKDSVKKPPALIPIRLGL